MLRFEPRHAVSVPNMNVPHIDPKLLIDPIHESWSVLRGPVLRGVLFDSSTGNAGDTQPTHAPCDKMTILADSEENMVGENKNLG